MRIAVLGPLEVRDDTGAPVRVPGAKERLLLAVLTADAGQVVPIDRLVHALWNGNQPTTARKSLQIHMVRLRSALEPDRPPGGDGSYVLRSGGGYALTVAGDDVDARRAADLVTRGRAGLAAGEPEEAARQLSEALGLWRGTPYGDWPDADFAETERRRLTEVRSSARLALLEARLALGQHVDAVPEAERLVADDPLREESWRLLMLALYRSGRQADALAAGTDARRVLRDEVGADPGPALRAMEAAVLGQEPALDLPRAPPVEEERPRRTVPCPWKGLSAYQPDDADLFRGRGRLTDALVARLVDTPLLAVSGPSGAGKSSVVRAGLLPALAAGALRGSERWDTVLVTPGRHPVEALATLTGPRPVVLVCDQFEELWAPGVAAGERTAVLDALLALMDDGVVVRCVVVVRGDSVGRLAEHPGFAERMGARLLLVPPMSDDELRQVVREPAAAVGMTADDELVEAVVADVCGRPGALPLLSAALVSTWERRRENRLTLAGYLGAGGVAGALAETAESAWWSLDDAGQEAARRLLVRLADTDESGALIRRPVPVAELDLGGSGGDARRAVVDVFVRRRLLAVDRDRLEVAHEALLSAWPRLARWLDDDAAGRAVLRHLAPAALDWERLGRPEDELYRGARLTAALDWASSAGTGPTPVEQRFLDASRVRADADLTAARERADHESDGRRRIRRFAMALAGMLVLALITTVLAVRAERDAERASLVADANRLAALSTTAIALRESLLLAAQAVRLAETDETQDGLLAALAQLDRVERVVPFDGYPFQMDLAGGGGVLFFDTGTGMAWQVGASTPSPAALDITTDMAGWRMVAPSPTDDVLLAGGHVDGRPWLRTVAADGSTSPLAEWQSIGGGIPIGAGYSADGSRVHLLLADPDTEDSNTVTRWRLVDIDASTGSVRETGVGRDVSGAVDDIVVDFADDGRSALVWDAAGAATPTLVNAVDGQIAVLETRERAAAGLGFIALPSGAAQLWEDGAVILFDERGTPVQELDAHQEPVRDVVVAPDGSWAVTVGDGPEVIVWDIDDATGRWGQREALTGHSGDVVNVAVDAAGGRMFTMSLDDTIITWDMSADGGLGRSYPRLADGRWISNRPQVVEPGRLLVAPTRSGAGIGEELGGEPGPGTESVAATFFDPVTGAVVDQVVVGDTLPHADFGSSVAVSPDRSMVAVTWGLGTTVLDSRTREVIAEIVLPPAEDLGIGPLPATAVWCAGWTPDGSTLLIGAESAVTTDASGTPARSSDGYLAPVDTRMWTVGEPIDLDAAPQSIDASPDGRVLAVASASAGEIVLVDATTLAVERRAVLSPSDLLGNLAYSPDGRLLAGGGVEGLLHVVDAATLEPVWEPAAVHDDWLLQTEWLADGGTVVTTGRDGTVSLFDAERGQVRGRPLRASAEPGEGYVHVVPAATDELTVLGGNRTGRRIPLDPSVWLQEACAIAGGEDLSAAEWARYLPGRDREPTCSDLG
jgi:DNA-binding SARP family transcriptional activator/WD40 repeat protein